MLLRYFYNQKLAHASYLVGCQAVGEAIVIDPGRNVDIYVEEAKANGMEIVGVTETHIHADYVSGSRELAERAGATLYLSAEGGPNWQYTFASEYKNQLVKDGDVFSVGKLNFEVMHTPGHTPEHISLLLTDGGRSEEPVGLFSGDFVFVGDIGRPDLLEEAAGVAGSADEGARQMFNSLKRFAQLPDYLQVWPAHGAGSACGKALGAVPSTTVGYEKRFNWALNEPNEDVFVQTLLDGQPTAPTYFAQMKRVNREGPAILHDKAEPSWLTSAQFTEVVGQGAKVVDTRAANRYAKGYLPGTINIPTSTLGSWAGWLLDYETPFYIIVDESSAREAIETLQYIGLDNIGGLFHDDILEERAADLESYPNQTVDELVDEINAGNVMLVDVRNDGEWGEGRIPNARHFMLGRLPEHVGDIVNGKPIVVQCRSGARSAIGASILKAHGVENVINMAGGIMAWEAAGYPVTS